MTPARSGAMMLWAALVLCGLLTGCRPRPPVHAAAGTPPRVPAPAALLGDFTDDYGNHFHITETEWRQLPHGRFHIARWNPARRYLIARNDSTNPSDPGLWTRIDWIPLEAMPPYTWAFCLSAYQAPSAAAAESSTVARPDTPRTGCSGHPFSRMARREGRDGRDGQDGR